MGRKNKIEVTASSEPMRWTDDSELESPIERGPSDSGNIFDIRMSEEADGVIAAHKIVDVIAEHGVCLVEANAPAQLLESAYYEALQLWEDGAFGPPFKVHDDRSMMEVQLWDRTLKDETKVVWIRESSESVKRMNALKLLSKNMSDFAAGLRDMLHKKVNVEFDRVGHAMLSCYTGDTQYTLHIDNSHGRDDDGPSLPDNGMRISCTYYLNTDWDPLEGSHGGLDVFLTDPKAMPPSAAVAKKASRLRVAPHADTLAIFLSERMAHQVIATRGKEAKWFALTVWGLSGAAMQQMARNIMAMRQQASKESDSDDD